MAQVQKKTSTMSVTISSCSRETSSYSSSSSSTSSTSLQQRHSSMVQPVALSPESTQTPCQYSRNGGIEPIFVKCLHDVSTVKGQLVVLECRIRGTPPLQVSWFREDEQIPDSADFRILRKKASSTTVPEELCTLVITEAYPEDSGIFKCVTANPFGTASCSALLEVYTDIDEVLSDGDVIGDSDRLENDNFPTLLQDVTGIPPPEWPDSHEKETASDTSMMQDFQPVSGTSKKTLIQVIKNSSSSALQTSTDTTKVLDTPTSQSTECENTAAKPYNPSSNLRAPAKVSSTSKSLADLPTFSPTLYAPCAFNYERPRHFIQSQPSFQAPSYESLQSNGSSNSSPYSSNISSPITTTASSFDHLSSAPASGSVRTSVTLIPRVSSSQSDDKSSSAEYLRSVLPSQGTAKGKYISMPQPQSMSPRYSPTSPSYLPSNSQQVPPSQPQNNSPCSPTSPQMSPKAMNTPALPQHSSMFPQPNNYKDTPKNLPKPILKKTISQPVLLSTDEEIQGSKDALIQDLEKKLRSKEARQKNNQKLSYEERMARRLLGPANAASVFEFGNPSESFPMQVRQKCSYTPLAYYWIQHHSLSDFGTSVPNTLNPMPLNHPDTIIFHTSSKGLSGGSLTEASTIQEKCYAPRFVQVPQDLVVEEGRFCRIDFKVVGLPTPDITWYLDGKAIRSDDYHKMLVCEKGVHSFIIEIVTVHHAGVYQCIARNRAGESHFSLRLDVIAQEVQHPPTFVVKMQNLRVLEGDTVKLECKVAASPDPQVYWKKDKEMLRIDPKRMSLFDDGYGHHSLHIERVVKSDAGWYTVSAINEAGMSTCNARLDVATKVSKTGPSAKPPKMLLITNQFSSLGSESSPHHTAPLYESEEL